MTGRPSDRPRAAGRSRRWVPAALWAATLLFATSWPNPNVPSVTHGDAVVHVLLYAVLAFLVAHGAPAAARRARGAAAIVVAASAFGAVDEWHQRFIPGRSASVDDWAADSVGAALGVLAARARRRAQPA